MRLPRPERPLDDSNGALTEFAAGLRRLREAAGGPGYRELGWRAHYSAGTLSEAASGKRLPSLEVTLAYVRACQGDVQEWERRWRRVAERISSDGVTGQARGDRFNRRPPYVGLAPFGPEDAEWFFGRERLTEQLVARVARQRFVVVAGPSGSGKSSLLGAGLAAAARTAALGAERVWSVTVITPGAQPLAVADRALRQCSPDTELVLVVDQFEEVFTLCHDEAERSRFIDAVLAAATAPDSEQHGGTRVVLGVRSDFYTHCMSYPGLVQAMQDAQLLVGPMTTDELQCAIVQPAVRAGCTVERSLVTELVAEAAGQAGMLPLVSHVLLETYRRRRGLTLPLTAYREAGGMRAAAARTAEHTYTALTAEQQTLAQHLFLRLTALGEGTDDTKRRITLDELDRTTSDGDIDVVLDAFVQARLLTVDGNSAQRTVEIAHEALIRSWPRLRAWLTEDRDGLRIHRQLTEAAAVWDADDREPGVLYRGARLELAQVWAADHSAALTLREREFLDASLSAQAQARAVFRQRTRRLRRLVALLATLLLVAVVAVGVAVHAQHTANEQRTTALAQKALREAAAIRATNPALAIQLALAAYRLDPTKPARDTLHEMFATPYATRLDNPTHNAASIVTNSPATKGPVFGLSVSADGQLLATASGLGVGVTVWDISDPFRPRELPALPTVTIYASSAAFSPRGRTLATTSPNSKTQLWDMTDPHHPRQLTSLGDALHRETSSGGIGAAVAFSPNGQVLATVGVDWTTRLWDITHPHHPALLTTIRSGSDAGSTPGVAADVAFSPDGHVLATLARDHTARLWDITNPHAPQPLGALTGHADYPLAVAFSPNGSVVATSGDDETVRLWNITDPRNPELTAQLTGHSGSVIKLAFSPDGRTLATANEDDTTRLWNIADPRRPSELTVLRGHTSAVRAVTFSPNGRTLITSSQDRTVRLADISPVVLASHAKRVLSVTYRPRSNIVATSSDDKTVRLWDLSDQSRPRLVHTIPTDDSFFALSFSPDGRLLLANGFHTAFRLWNVSDPNTPQDITSTPTRVSARAVFSPDGSVLVVAPRKGPIRNVQLLDITDPNHPQTIGLLPTRADGVAFAPDGNLLTVDGFRRKLCLWDITQPSDPRKIHTITAEGHIAAFSPDGNTLAVSNIEKHLAQLWDYSDPGHAKPLSTIPIGPNVGHPVSFSADGQRLAATAPDRSARVWDITNPRHPVEQDTLRGHVAEVLAVTFSPDGNTILAADNDHTIQQWQTDVDDLALHICSIAYPRLTHTEWETYFPNLNYQPPCP